MVSWWLLRRISPIHPACLLFTATGHPCFRSEINWPKKKKWCQSSEQMTVVLGVWDQAYVYPTATWVYKKCLLGTPSATPTFTITPTPAGYARPGRPAPSNTPETPMYLATTAVPTPRLGSRPRLFRPIPRYADQHACKPTHVKHQRNTACRPLTRNRWEE